LRIPLVINFFATAEHIHALSSPQLQNVVDAVMFEPGAWHPPKDKVMPIDIIMRRGVGMRVCVCGDIRLVFDIYSYSLYGQVVSCHAIGLIVQ
jgi:hypothetical protein